MYVIVKAEYLQTCLETELKHTIAYKNVPIISCAIMVHRNALQRADAAYHVKRIVHLTVKAVYLQTFGERSTTRRMTWA